MATIINNPREGNADTGNGLGTLIGVVLVIVILAILLIVGLPYLRRAADGAPADTGGNGGSINVQLPSPPAGGNDGAAQ